MTARKLTKMPTNLFSVISGILGVFVYFRQTRTPLPGQENLTKSNLFRCYQIVPEKRSSLQFCSLTEQAVNFPFEIIVRIIAMPYSFRIFVSQLTLKLS